MAHVAFDCLFFVAVTADRIQPGALKTREWKTPGDPASKEEMEHAERQTHQGVHDKI